MKKIVLCLMASSMCLSIFMVGCSKDSGNTAGGGGGTPAVCDAVTNKKFAADVSPLMVTKCSFNSGCHGTGSTNRGGVLLTHAQISAKAATIKSQINTGLMPQSGRITTAEKNTIICWVDNGALNN
jgi:uncharacterized membrane protein